jgi:hypothetical protein
MADYNVLRTGDNGRCYEGSLRMSVYFIDIARTLPPGWQNPISSRQL